MTKGELGKTFADGETIVREGEEGQVMYVIQEGRVRVSRTMDGSDVTIATLGPGDVFGEMALFETAPRSATVIAIGETRVLSVDKKMFFQSVSRDPSMAFNLLRTMSERLRKIDREFARLKQRRLEVLRSGLELEETCRIILEEASEAVDAENGSVMIVDTEGRYFEIKAAFGTEKREKAPLSPGEGIAGHVLATGKAELLNNVVLDPRFKPGALTIRSIICVPLAMGDENFGVINLSNTSEERLFSQADLKFVTSLAFYASVAVRNAISLAGMKKATDILLDGLDA